MKRIKNLTIALTLAALSLGTAYADKQPLPVDTCANVVATSVQLTPNESYQLEMQRLRTEETRLRTESQYRRERMDNDREVRDFAMRLGAIVVCCLSVAAVLITLLCIIYNLAKRRAKLSVVKKAIENNYELPAEFYGRTAVAAAPASQPTIVVMRDGLPTVLPQGGSAGEAPKASGNDAASSCVSYNTSSDERLSLNQRLAILFATKGKAVRSAVVYFALGVGLIFWGMADRLPFFFALGSVLLIIGAVRLWLMYGELSFARVASPDVRSAASAPSAQAAPQAPEEPAPAEVSPNA
jgi:hypothetical protein